MLNNSTLPGSLSVVSSWPEPAWLDPDRHSVKDHGGQTLGDFNRAGDWDQDVWFHCVKSQSLESCTSHGVKSVKCKALVLLSKTPCSYSQLAGGGGEGGGGGPNNMLYV